MPKKKSKIPENIQQGKHIYLVNQILFRLFPKASCLKEKVFPGFPAQDVYLVFICQLGDMLSRRFKKSSNL